MRLIDVDKFTKKLSDGIYSYDIRSVSECASAVYEMPTAYDKEKVIEELKQSAFNLHSDSDDDCYCDSEPFAVISLRKAISIVKRGGV